MYFEEDAAYNNAAKNESNDKYYSSYLYMVCYSFKNP